VAGPTGYTLSELMVSAAARLLRDGETVLVGIGLPQLACLLARATHAPNLKMVLELGVTEPEPVDPAIGIADPRLWYRGTCHTTFVDTLGKLLQRGRIQVGFLGGLQVDRHGNINSTQLGPPGRPSRHLNGSGGACDVAALAGRVLIIMPHERRRFPERVDYITSPGFLEGGRSREAAGLAGGPEKVITDLAVLGFDPQTRRMRAESLHPGVTPQQVQDATGFDLSLTGSEPQTPPPTVEELEILRTRLDPGRLYLSEGKMERSR